MGQEGNKKYLGMQRPMLASWKVEETALLILLGLHQPVTQVLCLCPYRDIVFRKQGDITSKPQETDHLRGDCGDTLRIWFLFLHFRNTYRNTSCPIYPSGYVIGAKLTTVPWWIHLYLPMCIIPSLPTVDVKREDCKLVFSLMCGVAVCMWSMYVHEFLQLHVYVEVRGQRRVFSTVALNLLLRQGLSLKPRAHWFN